MTAIEVLAAPAGAPRDQAIHDWCRSVWSAFAPANRAKVIQLLEQYRLA
jgi:hypothetical protein